MLAEANSIFWWYSKLPNGGNEILGRDTHIVGVANHILAGFVEQVEDAYGVEQCIAACYTVSIAFRAK